MATNSGILSSGAYQVSNVGIIPVVQSAIPQPQAQGYFAGPVCLAVINIPALSQFGCGPDSELIVNVTWGCSTGATAKTAFATFGTHNGAHFPWSDTQTTNVVNEWSFRISLQNSTQKAVVNAAPAFGGATAALGAVTVDFTQPTFLSIGGQLANATDTMQVLRYSVWLSNPATIQSTRINYPQKMFWGANAHYDDTTLAGGPWTVAQVISSLQQLGMTTLRMTYEGNASSLNVLIAVAKALQGTGISLICCIDISLQDSQSVLWKTEAAAFAYGWATGVLVAKTLTPYGVTIFECGNELDTKNGMNVIGDQGCYPISFSVAQWPIFRGIIGGCIAGVKSIPGTLACSNAFTLCGIGASDMLWDGTSPDGKSGFPKVQWDITSWHNYQPYGLLSLISRSFSAPNMNVLEYISRRYQRPILISEYNGQVGNTQAQQLAFWTLQSTEYYTNRYKYNIMGAMTYQLFQGFPDWALVQSAGTLYSPFGTGVQSFIAANPDSGT